MCHKNKLIFKSGFIIFASIMKMLYASIWIFILLWLSSCSGVERLEGRMQEAEQRLDKMEGRVGSLEATLAVPGEDRILITDRDSLLYERICDSIGRSLREEQQTRLDALYVKTDKQQLLFLASVSFCILILMLLLLRSVARKARLRIALEQAAGMKDQIENLKAGQGHLLKIIQEQYMEKIRELKTLSATYFYWEKQNIAKQKKMGELRTEEEILDKFREQLDELRHDSVMLDNLENVLEEMYGGLIGRIRNAYQQYGSRGNQLDGDDYKILVLMLAGFGSLQISLISGLDYDKVRKRKSRYIHKLETLPSPDAARLAEELKNNT